MYVALFAEHAFPVYELHVPAVLHVPLMHSPDPQSVPVVHPEHPVGIVVVHCPFVKSQYLVPTIAQFVDSVSVVPVVSVPPHLYIWFAEHW